MTSVNISNTQTDLYSDECNQIKENIQNDNHMNYQLLSYYTGDNTLSQIPGINTNVRNVGGLSTGYNVNINNNNLPETIDTENWLFRLNRVLSKCPTLNHPNNGKICNTNKVEDIDLRPVSSRTSHPLYNYRALDQYGFNQDGKNLNRYDNVHSIRPIASAVSFGMNTKLMEKDHHKNIKN